jgi:surface antigen
MRSVLLALLILASPAAALNEGLQCVPFARAVSGVEIRGDAHTWWGQAAGRYDRGNQPKVGAVLAFKPYAGMRLGHVAAVRRIVDDRTILVSHANWSLIDGTRGHIENNVRVIDVSDAGDWSKVRVWFDKLGDLGTTHWPVHGFIYPGKVRGEWEVKRAVAELTGGRSGWERPATVRVALASQPSVKSSVQSSVQSSTKMLRFSNGFMADIDKAAAKEASGRSVTFGAVKPKIKRDILGDLIAGIR